MSRITVHLVCNAHIDPVWLWPWTAGLDELVSTCETVCGLLERNPDVIFTRGEAWVYEQVERIAPKVFARIKRLVRKGQWEIVGGWYLQPDCNLPGLRGFERQIELGRDYFERRFGLYPETAYNVDSFGHHAGIPALLHAAGQRNYVMMRPEQQEMKLPASLFWWRGEPRGRSVLTFRIEGAYCTTRPLAREHVEMSVRSLPKGVHHAMCFIGLGDHGGGPSQEMIDWCRANRTAFPGVDLVFSSPARFFSAVRAEAKKHAPIVTGELQMHAIGCFSVHRPVKTKTRYAENLLIGAENALRHDRVLRAEFGDTLEKAWRWLCFTHFHDTLGGTAVPSAYAQVDAHLGYACAVGDEIMAIASRRIFAALPPDAAQRIAIHHFGQKPFDDWVEFEPWLEWTEWQRDWGLVDERGRQVEHQCMHSEAMHGAAPRLLFRVRAKPGSTRLLRIVRGLSPPDRSELRPSLGRGTDGDWEISERGQSWRLPELELVHEATDTWSHGVAAYEGDVVARSKWDAAQPIDSGPLMWSWMLRGRVGAVATTAEWRVYRDSPFYELRLSVTWTAEHQLLRLVWPQPEPIDHRLDGIPGQVLERPADGHERPLRDWTCLFSARKRQGAVVCPDVYSISAKGLALRLTLLRSPIMAHHDPDPGTHPRSVFSDRGVHSFRFRFYPVAPSIGALESAAAALGQLPCIGDVTRGMPLRALRGEYRPVDR